MANTFLDTKISSFIEDKFPEFVRTDHPVFVEFLRLYYEFMESAKITLVENQSPDNILLENELTTNFLLLEDGSKVYTDDSLFGVFEKGEIVTGLTSGATATVLAEDNANSAIYIEQNRFFQVGEIITGGSSKGVFTTSARLFSSGQACEAVYGTGKGGGTANGLLQSATTCQYRVGVCNSKAAS